MPHPTQMSAADTALLVIDLQEKLVPKIHNVAAMVRNVAFLIDGAKLLGLPVVATEQYPKGLGPTIPELAQRLPAERPEKVAFSACAIPSVIDGFRRAARPKVLCVGIETHVCVMGTALDLLAADFRVYLAVDAVGSRHPLDYEFALRRLEQAGAILTTSEAALFEWIGGASHPKFKDVSRMVQERMKAMNA